MNRPLRGCGRVRRIASAAGLPFLAALLIAGCIAASDVLLSSPAGADSGGSPGAWIIGETAGPVDVQIAGGAPWTPAEPGATLTGPATVRTGPDGGATLTRDDDRIVLSASTTVRLPGPDQADSATRIVQPEGEAFFEVGPRPGWTFSVDTPYLAVVVKGTKFGVDVSEAGTSVAVSEGRVQVERPGRDPADVSAGQTAQSGVAPGSDISIGETPESSTEVDMDSLAPGPAEGDISAAETGESASDGSGADGGGSSNGNSGGASAGNSGGASAGNSGGASAGNGAGASDSRSSENSSGNGAGNGNGNSGNASANGNGKSKPGKGQGND